MDMFEQSLVFLCLVAVLDFVSSYPKVYLHTLPNGETIQCNLCPPGSYLIAHCNKLTHESTCEVCPADYFQSTYNQADSCAPCSSCTMRRDRVYKTCNTTSDTECRCQDGYYLKSEGSSEGVCLPHSKCPKGEGVVVPGNYERDTECVACSEGYFSPNDSSTQICQPCSTCPSGHQIWEPCNSMYDTKCEPRLAGSTEYKRLPRGALAGIICGVVFTVLILLIVCIGCMARRGSGPKFFQSIYTKCSKRFSGQEVTNSNGYVPTRQGDDGDCRLDEQQKLLNTFTDLSKDLITKEWKFFFLKLFDQNADNYISEVEMNKPNNVREQIHTLLKDWVAREKEKATRDRLIKALKEHERHDLIEIYFTSSKKQSNGSAIGTEV